MVIELEPQLSVVCKLLVALAAISHVINDGEPPSTKGRPNPNTPNRPYWAPLAPNRPLRA